MNKLFAPFLPPWAETGLQPAFYDLESGTVLQQTARMYDKVNQLIRLFNELSEETQTTVEEYIAKFVELKDFVDTYFENLDVQEEINNKLDEMTEDGTLQEIIGDYLNATAVWGFDTVADMKASTNLIDGSYARTLGYYAKNDGGGSLYKITNSIDNSVHQEVLDSGLYANLIIESIADIRQYGVSTTNADNSVQLQEAIDRNTVLNGFNGTINVSGNITIKHTRFLYDFKRLKIVCNSNVTIGEFITIEGEDSERVRGSLSNLEIDSDGKANVSLAVYDTRAFLLKSIDLTGAIQKEIYVVGGKESTTANVQIRDVRCDVDRDITGFESCVGLYLNTHDNRVDGFVSHGYLKHIVNNGMAWLNDCHCWNWYEVVGSIGIETTTQVRIDNFYSDTLETAVNIVGSQAEQIWVNNIQFYMNPTAPDTSNCTPKPFVVNSGWITSGGRLKVTNGQFGGVAGKTANLITTPDGTYSNSTHYYNFVNCYTGSYLVQPRWFEYYRTTPTISYTDYSALTSPTTERSIIVHEKGACHYFFHIGGTLGTIALNTNVDLGKLDLPSGQPYGITMSGILVNSGKTYAIRWSISNTGVIRINVPDNASLSGYCTIILEGMTSQSTLPNE